MQYTFTKPANSTNVIITCDDTTNRYNNYGIGRGAAAIPSGENDFAIQLNTGTVIPFALSTTSFSSQQDAIDTLNSAAYLGFSSPSGGGGGNVADGTTDDSLLVWSGGAGSWVESNLMKLQTLFAGVFGFVSMVGTYSGFFGRVGNSTTVANRNNSGNANSSLTLEGATASLMANDGGSVTATLDIKTNEPPKVSRTGLQDAYIPYIQETDQEITTGIVDAIIAQNLSTDHDLFITSVTAYVISWTGTPNWDATFEVTANGVQVGNGSVTEPPLSTNLLTNTAILRYDQPVTDLLKFTVLGIETGASGMALRTLVTGFYRPRV